MKDTARFSETQSFAPFVYGIVGLSAATAVGVGLAWPLVPAVLTLNLLCLRTTLTGRELVVTFGAMVPLYRRRICLDEIVSAEAVIYSPIAEYGGWGIKGMPGNSALNARGNQGVRLTLRSGKRLLIGSQKPDALADALRPKM